MSCKRTLYKNCSCSVCRNRNPKYKQAFLDRHRSIYRQQKIEERTRGLVPSHQTLADWYSL